MSQSPAKFKYRFMILDTWRKIYGTLCYYSRR